MRDLSGSVQNAISRVVCHSIRVSLFPHFFLLILSACPFLPHFSFCSIFFLSLINVKYPVAQGLKEIIGKLLYNYLPDAASISILTRVSMNAIHCENYSLFHIRIFIDLRNNTKKKKNMEARKEHNIILTEFLTRRRIKILRSLLITLEN